MSEGGKGSEPDPFKHLNKLLPMCEKSTVNGGSSLSTFEGLCGQESAHHPSLFSPGSSLIAETYKVNVENLKNTIIESK